MPLKAGKNPGPPAVVWGFPPKASCSAGMYFTPLLFYTLIQVKSFNIKINVVICLEQGGTDHQMHVHEWFQ